MNRIRVLWNVLLGRPTIYRAVFPEGVVFAPMDHALVTECVIFGGNQTEHKLTLEQERMVLDHFRGLGFHVTAVT